MIQLSLPPEANKNFPSLEKVSPNHPLAITTESRSCIFSASISWILWSLSPLLVTASNFPEGETAMFRGRSPTGSIFPTGVSFQPLGRETLADSRSFRLWDCPRKGITKNNIRYNNQNVFLNLEFSMAIGIG